MCYYYLECYKNPLSKGVNILLGQLVIQCRHFKKKLSLKVCSLISASSFSAILDQQPWFYATRKDDATLYSGADYACPSLCVMMFREQTLLLVSTRVLYESVRSGRSRATPTVLPHKVKTQYINFGLHEEYFLLSWKIPEVTSRWSIIFHN